MNVVHLCRAVLAAAILMGMSLQPTGAADAVSFRLDWTLSGYHLPFYWAKEKGYYGAENLDVDIKEGAGSGKTVALMSGQQDDIGLADYMFMSVGVAKGMKLKGIFGEVQDGAWAVISRADSPIKKPEDLIGRSVATTADHKAMLDLLLAINKIPADKVKIQVTGAATRNTVFVNGQVDSFISVLIGSPLDLVVRAQQGKDKPVYFMPFADFGIAPMGQGLWRMSGLSPRSQRCCGALYGRAPRRSTRSSSRTRPRKRSTSPCGFPARAMTGASRSSCNGSRPRDGSPPRIRKVILWAG